MLCSVLLVGWLCVDVDVCVGAQWRGYSACIARAFPVNASCFLAYEYTRRWVDPFF
jgi:hypothetical protein